jgi:DNA-binding XRE family transcriptional regulator
MFIEQIKQLKEQCQTPQQQLAAALKTNQTVTCRKIEKGEGRKLLKTVYLCRNSKT